MISYIMNEGDKKHKVGATSNSRILTKMSSPPPANRGVMDTKEESASIQPDLVREAIADFLARRDGSGLKDGVHIDWLSCTFFDHPSGPIDFSGLMLILGWQGVPWEIMERGYRGYKQAARCGHVSVAWNGAEGMGIHIDFSGQGLVEFAEAGYFGDRKAVWDFLRKAYDYGAFKVTRLDVAWDDFTGQVDIDEVIRKLEAHEFTSRWQKWEVRAPKKLSSGEVLGRTVYCGSRQSGMFLRVYDKALQSGELGAALKLRHWVRVELEAHDEQATLLMAAMYKEGSFEPAAKVLNFHLAFREVGRGANRSRWAISEWWARVLDTVERMNLGLGRVPVSVERAVLWLSKQVSGTLEFVREYMLLYEKDNGSDWMERLAAMGRRRLQPWQLGILENG